MRYPFTKQEGAKDCGAACLQMLIKYYKGYVGMEELREETKTNRQGTNAYYLVEAAKKFGFDARGMRITIENLISKEIHLPLIAHVTYQARYHHYIVLYEINPKKEYLIIGDPASKVKKITFSEFEEIWSQVVIELYPRTPIPLKQGYRCRDVLFQILAIEKYHFLSFYLLTLFGSGLTILFSFTLQIMFDGLEKINGYFYFFQIFVLFLFVILLKNITQYIRLKLMAFINHRLDEGFMLETIEKILHFPYSHYRNHSSGDLLARITDLEQLKEMIQILILLIFDSFFAFLAFLLLLFLSQPFALAMGLEMLVLLISEQLLFYGKKKEIGDLQVTRASHLSYLVESLTNFEVIKGLHLEQIRSKQFRKLYQSFLKRTFQVERSLLKTNLFHHLFEDVCYLGYLFVGSIFIYETKMSIGLFFTLLSLREYFLQPFQGMGMNLSRIEEGKQALKRVLELPSKKEETGIINLPPQGNITFQNCFYFEQDVPILNGISFQIKKGEKVLLIGESGSGKSTILKLLMQYYACKREMIQLDQIVLADYQKRSLDQAICYLSQDEMLFTGTLFENLKLNRKISAKNIYDMAKRCEVEEIIKDKTLGYQMLIEENGFHLSGGERQRIILARTLLSNASILLIDEGTNQMDVNLERRILKRIFSHFKKETMIIVSHRLDNQDLFNHVIELQKGRIIRDDVRCQLLCSGS